MFGDMPCDAFTRRGGRLVGRVVEIIVYQLKEGTGGLFHQTVKNVGAPLHHEAGLEILAFGNSLHSEDAYVLIRVFDGYDQMTALLDRFYSSEAWKEGPRSTIVDNIITSSKSVLFLDDAAIEALKSSHTHT